MKKYKYRAKDREGKTLTGEVEAFSEGAAARVLREKGLIVISISASSEGLFSLITKFKTRVSSAELVTFTRQLSTMVNAGLAITDSLVILRSQSGPGMRPVVARILSDVEAGSSLSDALKKHPKVFSPIYIALVRSGETGGVLDQVMNRLADNLEKTQEFRGKVKGALVYPIIIVVGMAGVAFVMMVFVIPKLTQLYSDFDAKLPIATQILITISTFMAKFWPLIIFGVFGAIYGARLYKATPSGRRKIDGLIFKIPLIGKLQQQIILTEFTRTLSLMVGTGVSILEGLNVTAGVVGNVIVSDAIKAASKQVEKGFPVAYSLAQHPDAFPFILSQMVSVGEETGKMAEVLEKVSHVFEVESEQQVKMITAAIEPLIMVVLGIGVGFLVIAIILPIYNLTSQF